MVLDSQRWKCVGRGDATAQTPEGRPEAVPPLLFSVDGLTAVRGRGPMAFGTEKLQYMVQVGEHVRVARTAYDYVAYVIAHKALWLRR